MTAEWVSQGHEYMPGGDRDQEIDLGDGWWASVGRDGRPKFGAFSWSLYYAWRNEDPVAEGYTYTEEEAKAAALAAFAAAKKGPRDSTTRSR